MERIERRRFRGSPAFDAAAGIIRVLRRAGFDSGMVGGSVRDLLLGRTPEDFDLVTVARPEQLAALFPAPGWSGRDSAYRWSGSVNSRARSRPPGGAQLSGRPPSGTGPLYR